MNDTALIAVIIVCVTTIAVHVANLHHQRQRQRDLVRERQEDDRLERVSQRLHAERMVQADREHAAVMSSIVHAKDVLADVTRYAQRAEAAKVEVKDIVAGLNTNWDAIESRLQNIETALGWSRRGEP